MMSSDPVADFERFDAEQEFKLQRLPKCCLCGEHIQQEDAFHFKSAIGNRWICDECIESNREEIEDAV